MRSPRNIMRKVNVKPCTNANPGFEKAHFCNIELETAKTLLSSIKGDEKKYQQKKRRLMGFDATTSDRKCFKNPEILEDMFMPESSLREDDIYYESVRTYVEGLFGVCNIEGEFDIIGDDVLSADTHNIRKLISCLDIMTIKGLYLLAKIIKGDSVKLKETRVELKNIVKSVLSSALSNQNQNCHQLKVVNHLFEFISVSRSKSRHTAVKKVFRGLENFSCQTLNAMVRKLKGEEATIPQLRSGRKGWGSQMDLIEKVEKNSSRMISKLDEGDDLPKPLAKAMVVANLSLKIENQKDIYSKRFGQLAPKVKSLQDDIMTAIWRVGEVKISVLQNLTPLLKLEATISRRLLRPAFKEMLTEFLFECDDLKKIPKSLLDILDVINGSSVDKPLQLLRGEKINQEVDVILNLSAHMKQLALDLLPNYEFDEDFADAYVEEMEGSNDNCDSSESELDDMRRNKYLVIQSASDQTSMFTHKLIGGVLWEFAKLDDVDLNGSHNLYLTGDNQIKDVKGKGEDSSSSSKKDPKNLAIVRAVEKLVPSFSNSGAMERLKNLLE